MKQFGLFFAFALYFVGAIGGIGYCLWINQYVVALAILDLAILAWPTVKDIPNELMK